MVGAEIITLPARATPDVPMRREIEKQLDVSLKRIEDQLGAAKVALVTGGFPSKAFAADEI